MAEEGALARLKRDIEEIVRDRLAHWPPQWEGYHWPGYTWEHTLRVRNLALRLAREEGADRTVVDLAALLHDIEKPLGRDHAAAGARWARRELLARGVHETLAGRVASAIGSHAGDNTVRHPIENLVLGDADLIDANFGLVGVWRFITIRAGHGATVPETVQGFHDWLPRKDELLSLLHTESGMTVAEERRERMHRFCADVEQALADEKTRGVVALVEHINARHARGSIFEQLPDLRRIAQQSDGPRAVAACRRLAEEAAGEA
ncbi:MAG: HD domain-containing protein [Armatimonadota bacterium]